MNHNSQQSRCGYVAVVGLPNVGKSTLVNRFLCQKISIVSSKPQTTRTSILGILSHDNDQVIFFDTPGILEPHYRLQEVMKKSLNSAVSNSDVVLVIVDASDNRPESKKLFKSFINSFRNTVEIIIAVNKIDLVPDFNESGQLYSDLANGLKWFPVSALCGDNVEALLEYLISLLPYGPKLYPDDIIAEEPERFFVAELIRECVFNLLRKEIPYSAAVKVEEFREQPKRSKDFIRVVIYVERESQKPIVIGKGGKMLKTIGERSRAEVEKFLDRPVYLELFVKVKKDWRKKDGALRELGLIR